MVLQRNTSLKVAKCGGGCALGFRCEGKPPITPAAGTELLCRGRRGFPVDPHPDPPRHHLLRRESFSDCYSQAFMPFCWAQICIKKAQLSPMMWRGSIYTSSLVSRSYFPIKPDITSKIQPDTDYKTTQLHFGDLVMRYKNPIIILNLIKAAVILGFFKCFAAM